MPPILTRERLAELAVADAAGTWERLRAWCLEAASAPYGDAWERDLQQREKAFATLDLFLANSAWEAWSAYETDMPLTADVLVAWWRDRGPEGASSGGGASGRAILILDGLSLRELPWLLQGAKAQGLRLHQAQLTGAELPSETNAFAKAMGFGQRSALGHNRAGSAHHLPGATTDLLDCSFEDARNLVGHQPDLALWHTFPDQRLHDLSGPGGGVAALGKETRAAFTAPAFWAFVRHLATGRHLVITGDHGYAATGTFPDATPYETKYLAETFSAQRFRKGEREAPPAQDQAAPVFLPPLDLRLKTRHGDHRLALGRKKWKVAGGHPTLSHGGLSLLETLVPFLELSL